MEYDIPIIKMSSDIHFVHLIEDFSVDMSRHVFHQTKTKFRFFYEFLDVLEKCYLFYRLFGDIRIEFHFSLVYPSGNCVEVVR